MAECKCGCVHVEEKEDNRDIRIVILQRGWVMVGEFKQEGSKCSLDGTSVLRIWGTSRGLGELVNGPLPYTKLDPAGHVEFNELNVVASIRVNSAKWSKYVL